MQVNDLPKLLATIDQLIDQNMQAAPRKSRTRMGSSAADVEKILELGAYPPDDPSSVPRRALLAIGETLGAVGGFGLMKQVHDAYEAQYGRQRAARLSVRWDGAAGVWYD